MTVYATKAQGLLLLTQVHRQKSSGLLYRNMQAVGDLTTQVSIAKVVCQNTKLSSKPMNALVRQFFTQKNRKIMGGMSFLKMPLTNRELRDEH